jgi:quinol monooxygenase YgiN
VIIVSGRIRVAEDQMPAFLEASREAVVQARQTEGCLDFVVASDPLESDRVNVYEEWESEEALLRFRGDGPGDEMGAQILDAQVRRHHVSRSGPA